MKKLHKTILLSRVYGLSSADDEKNLAVDPDNQWHWRFERRRLDAESLRDTLLAVSGTLDPTPAAEPHPFPPQEKWEFTQHHPFRAEYPTNKRTVYQMSARLTASAFLQTFDGPDPNASTPVRDSSITTVQALYWLNDKTLHQRAEAFGKRIMRERSDEVPRIERAFQLALQRGPTEEEYSAAEAFLAQARQHLTNVPEAQREEKVWGAFARGLFRANEFLYVD